MSALTFTPSGICCAAGDFCVDPWRPVSRTLITRGHADHAGSGMGAYLAAGPAPPVMQYRLGDVAIQTVRYGETRRIGDATVSFHPAGHVPGSAQIRVEVAGEVRGAPGDCKMVDDGLSTPFEPFTRHRFITESMFGLPVFRWPDQAEAARRINGWRAICAAAGKTAFPGCYALGKAQRLLTLLDQNNGPVLAHTAIENTNATMRTQDIRLPRTVLAGPAFVPEDHPGALVLAPPSAPDSAWARKFGPGETAFASGWNGMVSIYDNPHLRNVAQPLKKYAIHYPQMPP